MIKLYALCSCIRKHSTMPLSLGLQLQIDLGAMDVLHKEASALHLGAKHTHLARESERLKKVE